MIILNRKKIIFIISILVVSFIFVVINGNVYGDSISIVNRKWWIYGYFRCRTWSARWWSRK